MRVWTGQYVTQAAQCRLDPLRHASVAAGRVGPPEGEDRDGGHLRTGQFRERERELDRRAVVSRGVIGSDDRGGHERLLGVKRVG